MRRFSILAALFLGLLVWSANSASAQTTFAVQTPVVSASTVVTPVTWGGYYGPYYRPYASYYRPYTSYYRPYYAPYYRPYVAPYYYRPYVAPYRAYYPGYYNGYWARPYVGFGVY